MARPKVLTRPRIILTDLHLRVTEHNLLHATIISLNVNDGLLAAIPRLALPDTTGRIQGNILALILGHTLQVYPNQHLDFGD